MRASAGDWACWGAPALALTTPTLAGPARFPRKLRFPAWTPLATVTFTDSAEVPGAPSGAPEMLTAPPPHAGPGARPHPQRSPSLPAGGSSAQPALGTWRGMRRGGRHLLCPDWHAGPGLWPELPLRVPERTAGGCRGEPGAPGPLTTPGRRRGRLAPPAPLHPAEQTRACPSGDHHRATRRVQLGPLLRQKRLKANRDQVRPTPSSRTRRSGVWGRRKKKSGRQLAGHPGPMGRPPHSFGY